MNSHLDDISSAQPSLCSGNGEASARPAPLLKNARNGRYTHGGGRWAVSPRRAEDGGGGRRHIMVAAVEHRTNFRRKGSLRDNEIPAVATLAQQLGFLPLVGIFFS